MLHPRRSTPLSPILLVVLALAGLASIGCTTRVYGRGYVRYSQPVVFAQAPDLVYVAPGVYVVQDYNDPVYYSDGYYWSNRGGVWYRTGYWSDPWVRVHAGVVPRTFASWDHRAYVRYRARAGVATYRAPARTYQASAPSVRHHSPPQGAPPPTGRVSASVDVSGRVVHQRRDDGDRSARTERSRAEPEPQPKVIPPQSDRQATEPVKRQPARSDANRSKSRSSDSSPSRSKKSKRR